MLKLTTPKTIANNGKGISLKFILGTYSISIEISSTISTFDLSLTSLSLDEFL